jgi:hypothetical protein
MLYGKAGACRYKTYGVEYRTLSNFWVLSTDLRREVWERTMAACQAFFEHDIVMNENIEEELKLKINCEE